MKLEKRFTIFIILAKGRRKTMLKDMEEDLVRGCQFVNKGTDELMIILDQKNVVYTVPNHLKDCEKKGHSAPFYSYWTVP